MKIIVAIKRALDYTARVRVKPDGSGVDLTGARMSMNPFCEIALEVGGRGVDEGRARWRRWETRIHLLSNFSFFFFPLSNNHIQEAIRLKEAGHAEEVVAVSVGPKECQVRAKGFR